MKRKILILILALVSVPSYARRGGQDGSGGGGIVRNKEYITFGTADLRIDPQAKQTLPSLDLIEQAIEAFKISDAQKSFLLREVYPVNGRRYYDITAEGLAAGAVEKVKAEYVKLSGLPADQLALFAITDTKSRSTYLLPEFYQLKPAAQAAILWHEAYWILRPGTTYAETVEAEIAFQKYVESSDGDAFSPVLARALTRIFNDKFLAINWALASDLAKGNLGDLATSGRGANAHKIFEIARRGYRYSDRQIRGDLCRARPEADAISLYALARKYPSSAFLPLLAEKIHSKFDGFGELEISFLPVPVPGLAANSGLNDCFLPLEQTHEWHFTEIENAPGTARWRLHIKRILPSGRTEIAGER